jgi:hypothetical protein
VSGGASRVDDTHARYVCGDAMMILPLVIHFVVPRISAFRQCGTFPSLLVEVYGYDRSEGYRGFVFIPRRRMRFDL